MKLSLKPSTHLQQFHSTIVGGPKFPRGSLVDIKALKRRGFVDQGSTLPESCATGRNKAKKKVYRRASLN